MKHTDYPVCTNRWDGQKDPPRSTPDNMWGGDVRVRVVPLLPIIQKNNMHTLYPKIA